MTVTDAQVGAAMNALVTYYEAQGHTVRPESIDYQALRVALDAVVTDLVERAETAESAMEGADLTIADLHGEPPRAAQLCTKDRDCIRSDGHAEGCLS